MSEYLILYLGFYVGIEDDLDENENENLDHISLFLSIPINSYFKMRDENKLRFIVEYIIL